MVVLQSSCRGIRRSFAASGRPPRSLYRVARNGDLPLCKHSQRDADRARLRTSRLRTLAAQYQ